jgi:hypothetical protein
MIGASIETTRELWALANIHLAPTAAALCGRDRNSAGSARNCIQPRGGVCAGLIGLVVPMTRGWIGRD